MLFLKLEVLDLSTGLHFALDDVMTKRVFDDPEKVICVKEIGSNKVLTERELEEILALKENGWKTPVYIPEINPKIVAEMAAIINHERKLHDEKHYKVST